VVAALIMTGVIAFLALRISSQEAYKASSSGATIDLGVPAALQVQVTEAGTYTITAGPAIEGGVEPQILVGK
jgi:hypothetical protein